MNEISNNHTGILKFFYATIAQLFYQCSPVAGATYSLAIRAKRDVNTPAMAEATGVVGTDGVTFEINTFNATFKSAVTGGEIKAWLEIYNDATQVFLQRQVVCVNRAGSPNGEPPGPVSRYYTITEVNELLAAKLTTPAGGSPNQVIGKAADGALSWLNLPSDFYTVAQTDSLLAAKLTTPAGGSPNQVIGKAADGALSWLNLPSDFYTVAQTNSLLAAKLTTPAGGSAGQFLAKTTDGAAWAWTGGDIVTLNSPSFAPEAGKLYRKTIASGETYSFQLAAPGRVVEFFLQLYMGDEALSFALPAGVYWRDSGGEVSLLNPPPAFDRVLCWYSLRFTYDGARLLGELANTIPDAFELGIATTASSMTFGFNCGVPSGESAMVDWGDGTIESVSGSSMTHTYASVGNFTVKMKGEFSKLNFYNIPGMPSATTCATMIRSSNFNWHALGSGTFDFNSLFYYCQYMTGTCKSFDGLLDRAGTAANYSFWARCSAAVDLSTVRFSTTDSNALNIGTCFFYSSGVTGSVASFMRHLPKASALANSFSYTNATPFSNDLSAPDYFEIELTTTSANQEWGFTPTSATGRWYVFDWGDGTAVTANKNTDVFVSGTQIKHSFATPGTYHIKLAMNASAITFDSYTRDNNNWAALGNPTHA